MELAEVVHRFPLGPETRRENSFASIWGEWWGRGGGRAAQSEIKREKGNQLTIMLDNHRIERSEHGWY
jgi:hypothetical protein